MKLSSARFSSKALLILGIVSFLITALYFGRQVLLYRDMLRYSPQRWWQEAPRPLADTSASSAPGQTLSYFGCKFEVPWPGAVREWTRDYGRRAEIQFDTGQIVLFWDPAYSQGDSLSGYSDSKYEHLKSVLSFTLSGMSPFLSHRDFARQRDRFMAKGFMLEHSGATDIFSIETQRYKGFEVSGLSYNGRVAIGLFDPADHQYLIEITQVPGRLIKTSQQDVNRLIQSFGPARDGAWVEAPQPQAQFGLYR